MGEMLVALIIMAGGKRELGRNRSDSESADLGYEGRPSGIARSRGLLPMLHLRRMKAAISEPASRGKRVN
jgi:hypothetical protein